MATSPVERPYDASQVFKTALEFHHTSEFIMSKLDFEKEPHYAVMAGQPYVALTALTIELLLKTLHALQSNNTVPQTHNLGKLFRGLDGRTKREIQKRWELIYAEWHERWEQIRALENDMPKNSSSVMLALDEASKAFEQSRYNFEPEAQKMNYYVEGLRKPLISIIVTKAPHLQVYRFEAPRKTAWADLERNGPRRRSKKP